MLKSSIKQNFRLLSKCRWPAKRFPKQKDLSRTE